MSNTLQQYKKISPGDEPGQNQGEKEEGERP